MQGVAFGGALLVGLYELVERHREEHLVVHPRHHGGLLVALLQEATFLVRVVAPV